MSKITHRDTMKVDRSQIVHPNITLSNSAFEQLNLIIENDFTLTDKVIRISIDGKECSGFTYALGFTAADSDDFVVEVKDLKKNIHLDPFCAHYLSKAFISYEVDEISHKDGFIVTNENQHFYQNKFWLENQETLLPLQD